MGDRKGQRRGVLVEVYERGRVRRSIVVDVAARLVAAERATGYLSFGFREISMEYPRFDVEGLFDRIERFDYKSEDEGWRLERANETAEEQPCRQG